MHCLFWFGCFFNVNNELDVLVHLQEISYSRVNHPDEVFNIGEKHDLKVISVDKEFMDKLNQDFIDYNLRDIVSKETKNVRELIIAKAFSNGEYDEDPPGELNDPLGGTFV